MSADKPWVPPAYWRVVVPFGIIFVIMFTVLNLALTAQPQFAIRESCLDLGLPPDCAADDALDKASQYNIIAMLIPGVLTLIAVGVFGAVQNQLGRPILLFITILGQLFATSGWFVVYVLDDTRSAWKVITIFGGALQACVGSYLVLYLAVFGVITDLSSRHPEKRVYYFVVLDLVMGLCTIMGTQSAAWFLQSSPANLTIVSVSLLSFALVFTILCMPETVSPELKGEMVDWKRANICVQMRFMFHNAPDTKEKLTKDGVMVYNKIKAVYELQQNIPFSEPYTLGSIDAGGVTIENDGGDDLHFNTHQDDLHHRDRHDKYDHQYEYAAHSTAADIGDKSNPISRKFFRKSPSAPDVELRTLGNTDMISSDPLNPTDVIINDATSHREHQLIPHPHILPPLDLPQPPRYLPPRNGIGILLVSLGLNMLVFLGHKICDLYYLKHSFKITAQDYSNLLSVSTIVRSVAAFIFFPLFKKYVKSPSQEIRALYIGCTIQGVLYLFYPLMPSFISYSILNITNFAVSTLPTSIVRSAASNHVSEQYQQYVLAALVGSEVVVILFGGVASNIVWLTTAHSMPGAIYIICGILSFFAALVLVFWLQDSSKDYDLRIAMTTQYVKINTLEAQQNKSMNNIESATQNHNDFDYGNHGSKFQITNDQFNAFLVDDPHLVHTDNNTNSGSDDSNANNGATPVILPVPDQYDTAIAIAR